MVDKDPKAEAEAKKKKEREEADAKVKADADAKREKADSDAKEKRDKADAEAKAKRDQEDADAKAKREKEDASSKAPVKLGGDKKDVEPQPSDDEKKPVTVRIYKSRDGRRFYGEDWGDGKFIDKASGKEVEVFEKKVTIKRPDPDNPKRMIPKEIFVKDCRLKGEKE